MSNLGYTCQSVHISVPATSANLGPGFDALGLALDYRDHAAFTLLDSDDPTDVQVHIEGEGADTLPKDASHLVVRAFYQACDALNLRKRAIRLDAHNAIPQSRGLGSSAEAIVTGVTAAAAFAGLSGKLAKDFIFELAAGIEGHPDNVAPAVYGALTASWASQYPNEAAKQYHTVRYPVNRNVHAWVIIPDYELSTQAAREALPHDVPRADALFNVSRATLLPAALVDGIAYSSTLTSADNADSAGNASDANQQTAQGTQVAQETEDDAWQADQALLLAATEDTLHQRYRSSLMQPSWDVMQALRQAGIAATISGAGPCVLALVTTTHESQVVAADRTIREIIEPWLHNSEWRVIHPTIDEHGVMWQCTKEA